MSRRPVSRPPYRPDVTLLARGAAMLVATITAATSARAQTTPHALRVEDLFRIASVSSPVVSPDGTRAAYVLSTRDLEESSERSDVWMVELPDGEPRRMTRSEESASSPAFSPDGRYLSFLASRGEGAETQVWAMDLRGGEARPLTEIEQGVSDYVWAPDARRLALLIRDAAGQERDDGDPRPPWVIDRLQFKRDYRGYLDRRRTHAYVLDLATEELTRLTDGDYDDGSMSWSPDGSRLAFVSNRTAEPDSNYDTDVWVLPVDGGSADLLEISPGTGADHAPVWSPDGTTIAWLTSLRPEIGGYAMAHLALATPGEPPRVLTERLDRNVRSPRFNQDGDSILAILESEGTQSLVSVSAAGGPPTTLWSGMRDVEAFAPVPGGGVVVQASSATAPSELWLVEAQGVGHRLTRHNDDLLAELKLGRVVDEWLTAPDGTRLQAFYTFPPDAGESGAVATAPEGRGAAGRDAAANGRPTILWIHGGPMGQDSWGWHGLRQLFAAHGYLVVQPNYRGSHGYGQDFALGLWQAWGGPERIDAMASVDHAIERGWADSTRLGVGGWSYGAITTNAIITHTDRFSAAISGAGAALHVASWGHDQYQRWYAQELGLPWENRHLWERLSTFNRVEEITTPTLWMGGEVDWNVPIIQSELMYQSMRHLGRETLLVVYPGQSHGGFPPVYEADRYRRFLGWFGRYLLDDDGMWPGGA